MDYVKIIQNGGSKMADASGSFLVINNVIVTSLLLFKVIYMLANFYPANGRRFSSLIAAEGRFARRKVCDSETETPYW